jgi:hypothetical protein
MPTWRPLSVEEPILWLAVIWATVIVYETLYTLLHVLDARKAGPGALKVASG